MDLVEDKIKWLCCRPYGWSCFVGTIGIPDGCMLRSQRRRGNGSQVGRCRQPCVVPIDRTCIGQQRLYESTAHDTLLRWPSRIWLFGQCVLIEMSFLCRSCCANCNGAN